MVAWHAHLAREEGRYADGLGRLPADRDARQRQLVRVANAACGAGLASSMLGDEERARSWFSLSAEHYRRSYGDAPPESFGRLVGAVKMRLLAGDELQLQEDAEWALQEVPAGSSSAICLYAACLAELALTADGRALTLAETLRAEPPSAFPNVVATALTGLASHDLELYRVGLAGTLQSFERRDAYLDDVPVADTVLVLEALARPRGLAVRPRSQLLPTVAEETPSGDRLR